MIPGTAPTRRRGASNGLYTPLIRRRLVGFREKMQAVGD